MSTSTTFETLAERLWPAATWPRHLLLAVFGSVLLYASAKVQVPMYPVPMTMQTFVVLVIGMAYGWRLAGATVAVYLLEGAVGLPVFAGTPERGIGLAYMVGPTGGFLFGFLLAAAAMGWLAERGWGRSSLTTAAAMAIGTVLLFGPGVGWLASFVGLERAFAAGFLPFMYGEAAKIVLAVALLPLAWRSVGPVR